MQVRSPTAATRAVAVTVSDALDVAEALTHPVGPAEDPELPVVLRDALIEFDESLACVADKLEDQIARTDAIAIDDPREGGAAGGRCRETCCGSGAAAGGAGGVSDGEAVEADIGEVAVVHCGEFVVESATGAVIGECLLQPGQDPGVRDVVGIVELADGVCHGWLLSCRSAAAAGRQRGARSRAQRPYTA
jgi:hypothetical protein